MLYHNQSENIEELDFENAKSDNETLNKLHSTHLKDQDEEDFEGNTPTPKSRREATKLLESNLTNNSKPTSNELN